MKSKKRIWSIGSMLIIMLLCCVNVTYAWESMNQAAWNVYVKEAEEEPPNPDDRPPVKPDEKPKPEKPSSKPGSTSKPTEKPADHETPKDEPTKVPEGTIQNGKYQMTTGDTFEFIFYMVIMLLSIAVMIMLGAMMIVLLPHGLEVRRK